jgi:hypothetical protein
MIALGNLGFALGAGSFLLGSMLVPFVGGTLLLIVPVIIWLATRPEGDWLQPGKPGGGLSGRQAVGWDARMARRGSVGRRRW